MKMCLSTVWHLVSHYFDCCEGTINTMFTPEALLGRACLRLTFDIRRRVCVHYFDLTATSAHPNVQLKTRSHTRVRVFLAKSYLYAFLVTWHSCLYHVLSHYFDWSECLHSFWHTRRRFWTILCFGRHVCTQVLRPREVFTHKYCLTRTRFSGRSERSMTRCQCKRHISTQFWLTKRWELWLGLVLELLLVIGLELVLGLGLGLYHKAKSETGQELRLGLGFGLGLGLALDELEVEAISSSSSSNANPKPNPNPRV